MTTILHRARRYLLAGLGLVVIATCATACEPANDFTITNATSQPLTVQERDQHPGGQPLPLSPVDKRFTLQPGAKVSLLLNLRRGTCVNIEILAYDASSRLVDQDPTPICEDTHGHGNTWLIKGK